MKKRLFTILMLLIVGFSLISCNLFGNDVKLVYLDVTVSPDNYVFSVGDNVKDHLLVKGYFSNGSEETITDYSTDIDSVTPTTKSVTVTYAGKTNTIQIFVKDDSKTLVSIDVALDKHVFGVGEDIKSHLTVKGIYSDSSEQILSDTDYTVSPAQVSSTTDKITVSYTEGEITKSKTINISVGENIGTLEEIEIFSLPTKIKYLENAEFDVSGLVVVGLYSDGSKIVITDYTLSLKNGESVGTVSGTDLSTTKTNTVTYNGDNNIKTSFEIKVSQKQSYTMKKGTEWFSSEDNGRDNITKIVFDYTDNLPSDIREKLLKKPLINIGNTYDDMIYLFKEGTELYVFSDGLICGNNDCANMFSNFYQLTEITFNNFDTSEVKDMSNMFYFCPSLTELNISSWDTTAVTDMDFMFDLCELLTTLNIGSWNTSNVTTMQAMFSKCHSLTILDISNWNTSNVKNMTGMFEETGLTSLDLSRWNTSNVEDMYGMFRQSASLTTLNVSGWDTSNVTDMRSMFSGCSNLQSLDLSNFVTSNVTGMDSMFTGCSSLVTLNVSGWNTSKVTTMDSMFCDCYLLEALDLTSFSTTIVADKDNMFRDFGKVGTTVTINPEYYDFFKMTNIGDTGWNYTTDVGTFECNTKSTYTMKQKSEWLPSSVDKTEITKIVFTYTKDLPQNITAKMDTKIHIGNTDSDLIYLIADGTELYVFSDWMICGNRNCSYMFSGFSSLTDINFSNFDTTNVIYMDRMFKECGLAILDLRTWDVSRVENMVEMFSLCSSLKELDLSTWNTSNVNTMGYMFSLCKELVTLQIGDNWDTSKVTTMANMFNSCQKLTSLDLSSWNTSNVTDMSSMFSLCTSLETLNLSNWDLSQGPNMNMIFWGRNDFDKVGATITINPTYKEYFDRLLSYIGIYVWDYSEPTYTLIKNPKLK